MKRKSLALHRLAEDQRGGPTQAIVCAEEALNVLEQIEDPEAADLRRQVAQWQRYILLLSAIAAKQRVEP